MFHDYSMISRFQNTQGSGKGSMIIEIITNPPLYFSEKLSGDDFSSFVQIVILDFDIAHSLYSLKIQV